MLTDYLRIALNVLFASGQIALPLLLFSRGFEASVARPAVDVAPNPATPAGYAFAVWGVIYIGSAAYAVYQALPAQFDDPLLKRIGWLTASGFALCCGWLLSARFGPVVLTVPIIVGMLLVLGAAFMIAVRDLRADGGPPYWFVTVPLAIYVGWLSAATFVNAADVLPGYGFGRFGLSPKSFGLLVIAAAAIVSAAVCVLAKGNPFYVGTVVWALVAIAVRNGFSGAEAVIAAAALASAVALVALTVARA